MRLEFAWAKSLSSAQSACLHEQVIPSQPRETEMRPTFHFQIDCFQPNPNRGPI